MAISTEQCIIQLQQMEQNLKDTLAAQKALQDNIPYYLEKNLICFYLFPAFSIILLIVFLVSIFR